MAPSHTVKVLEHCRVSPPPGSVIQTSLPLTFFDLLWLSTPPFEHLLFYEFTHPKTHLTHTLLPHIKHSLSLTLQHFYPLAGNLTWSPESDKPTIRYVEGDSVSLTIAESSHSDFHHLSGNHARDVNEFHSLVPQLKASSDTLVPVLALQATLFPNYGICVGVTVHYGVVDGSTTMHFLKTWASMCKLGGLTVPESLPLYDRTLIKDPNGLERIYLNELGVLKGSLRVRSLETRTDMVRATFVLTRADVEKLKQWVFLARPMNDFYVSTYVLICAYVLVCLVNARGDMGHKNIHFGFATGCKTRLNPPIPSTYFGNCIGNCWVSIMKSDLEGEDGFVVAAEAIGKAIKELENGVLIGAENWVSKNNPFMSPSLPERVTVAGSLKLNFYEIDFGWGRPRKSEVISIEKTGAISLTERGDGGGGVEIGLALTNHEMGIFSSLFANGLNALG